MSCIDEYLTCTEAKVSVISTVARAQPIGIRRISAETGIPEHRVRYVIGILSDAGALRATSRGHILGDRWEEQLSRILETNSRVACESDSISRRIVLL